MFQRIPEGFRGALFVLVGTGLLACSNGRGLVSMLVLVDP